MNIYGVINIDIVNSRRLKYRSIKQEELNEYIEKINYEYGDLLVSPITFTLGDEWQIVLRVPSKSYYFIEKFQKFLKQYNIQIYAGIGIGEISTNIYNDTRLMDGECFIRAREALNIVKKKNRFYNYQLNSKENRIYFNAKEISYRNTFKETSGTDNLTDVAITIDNGINNKYMDVLSLNKIINVLIENNEVLKSKITKKQSEIIQLYEEVGSYNNILKRKKNTTKSSISQKINDSNYFVIQNNKIMIESLLKLYCDIRKGNGYAF